MSKKKELVQICKNCGFFDGGISTDPSSSYCCNRTYWKHLEGSLIPEIPFVNAEDSCELWTGDKDIVIKEMRSIFKTTKKEN